MKKKIITRSLKIISFALAIVFSVQLLQTYVLCHYDLNRLRIDGYYLEDKGSLDVVFIGASDIYSGFSPGLAYEKFGYTSYLYTTSSNTAGAALTQMKEVLRTQTPKLIVFEVNCFTQSNLFNEEKESSIKNYIDNVPLNGNKIDYIQKNVTSDQLEYYIPFAKYHNTWSEYPGGYKFMFEFIRQRLRGYSLLKGFKSRTDPFNPSITVYNNDVLHEEKRTPMHEELEKEAARIA